MVLRKLDKVKKRDGRVIPYDESKIAEAIYRSACSVGQDNRFLAQDLAAVVTLYLERYYQKEVPESGEIREMVEKIIMETGHADIARAFILYGDNKWKSRSGDAEVAHEQSTYDLFPGKELTVSAATRDEVSMWGREKIASALVKEAGIPAETAEEIASLVEQKILHAGVTRISTSMIRELVDSELFLRGYGSKIRKQFVVGLPKYDLKRLIHNEEEGAGGLPKPDPEQLCATIGKSTLRQYALQEIFSKDVADAHLEGRVHIHHLDYPLKQYWVAPSVEHVRNHGVHASGMRSAQPPSDSPRLLTSQLEIVCGQAAKYFAQAVELNHLNVFYAPYFEDAGSPSLAEEMFYLLWALNRAEGGVVSSIDLALPPSLKGLAVKAGMRAGSGLTYGACADAVLGLGREVARLWGNNVCSTTGYPEKCITVNRNAIADQRSLDLLKEICRVASEQGNLLVIFDRGETAPLRLSRFGISTATPANPLGNEEEWFAVAGVVSLNLPQLTYRSEIGGKDFYAELDESLNAALSAHQQKRHLLRRFVDRNDGAFGNRIGWTADGKGALKYDDFVYTIAVAGLNETVKLMCGKEMAEDDQAVKLALRIMSYIYFRIKEEGRKRGMRLSIDDIPQEEAIDRFIRIDAQMYPRARGILMAGRSAGGYSPGFHLKRGTGTTPARALAVEGRFHTLVESGKVIIDPVDGVRLSSNDLYALVLHAYSETNVSQLMIR